MNKEAVPALMSLWSEFNRPDGHQLFYSIKLVSPSKLDVLMKCSSTCLGSLSLVFVNILEIRIMICMITQISEESFTICLSLRTDVFSSAH